MKINKKLIIVTFVLFVVFSLLPLGSYYLERTHTVQLGPSIALWERERDESMYFFCLSNDAASPGPIGYGWPSVVLEGLDDSVCYGYLNIYPIGMLINGFAAFTLVSIGIVIKRRKNRE